MKPVNVAGMTVSAFDEVFAAVMEHTASEFWLKGGRGSTKSSFISICIVLLVIQNHDANAVIMRRFSNTLRRSVYTQMLWAIRELGLADYFRATVSPMEMTYKPTGQKILFLGLDDPLKSKGAVFEVGYAAIQWFEELDQFTSWDDISSALKSYKRGGDMFWTFYSYNPPKTMWSWVNAKALEMEHKPGCVVHHSTYLDVVANGTSAWIGEPFIEDAEWLKATNPMQYRWELLGEITGTGGNVFDNVVRRAVTEKEIQTFDNFRNGIDWGWFPDPWRFIRCEFQANARRLIIFDEHSAVKTLPSETGRIVVEALTYSDDSKTAAYFHDQSIWCDDTADGKVQMATYKREYGLHVRPARKGNMRRLSYQWLAGLREIVIDDARCPLTFEEFASKEYERDKDGRWVDEIPDGNDHSIDAVRYAVMDDVIRGRAS